MSGSMFLFGFWIIVVFAGLFAAGVGYHRPVEAYISGPLLGLVIGFILGWNRVRLTAGDGK